VRQWPERVWAVEGANGIGRPLCRRLLASGERVLDVPAKLAARAPVFDTGQGRKTDPADAHAIVMVALRDKRLREVTADPGLTVLRLLCDRRDELSHARAQALNRLHRLFTELIPGGAPSALTSATMTSPTSSYTSLNRPCVLIFWAWYRLSSVGLT
jgi:transposase